MSGFIRGGWRRAADRGQLAAVVRVGAGSGDTEKEERDTIWKIGALDGWLDGSVRDTRRPGR